MQPPDASPEKATEKAKVFPCNPILRDKLREMRDAPDSIWSNAELGKKLNYNSSVISQYLSDDGCKYNVQGSGRDGISLEQKAADFLQAIERRRASGIETHTSDVAEQILDAFEIIRKTNDLGAIVADSGEGKTRGIELVRKTNPLARLIEAAEWNCDKHSMWREFWNATPHDNWDRQTPQAIWMIQKLRGTDWPFLIDDAHKLSRPALSLIASLQEKTNCPIALFGTAELVKKLEDDPQRYSRVGIHWSVQSAPKTNSKLLKHMIQSIAKTINGDLDEMMELCKQVASHHGHFRAVHKQLKVAAEIRLGDETLTWPAAFRKAHGHLLRPYKLS